MEITVERDYEMSAEKVVKGAVDVPTDPHLSLVIFELYVFLTFILNIKYRDTEVRSITAFCS